MTAEQSSPRARAGLLVSEFVFLLLIVGVLGALILSALLHMSRSTERLADADPLAVHQARYLRYLAYVPERSEKGEDLLAAQADLAGERRRERRSPASVALPPSAAGGSGGASSVAGAPESSTEARSTLVPSAAGSSAGRVEVENNLEVVIVNVAGESRSAAAPAGTGGGPQAQRDRQDRESGGGASGGSGTLFLVGTPSGVNAPAKPETPTSRLVSGIGQAGGRSARRLEFHDRGADVWKRWPDANRRNIAGAQGVGALNHALDLLKDSDAHTVADDLFRKGIVITFGEPSEFIGGHTHAAEFLYTAARPPDEPIPPPAIRLNPKFLHEDPRVLAALLAHEGTHFQQYLTGTLLRGSVEHVELEAQAWMNGAVMWQQVRGSALSLKTPLVRDLEVGYQMARQGEGLLRDLVAALYTQ